MIELKDEKSLHTVTVASDLTKLAAVENLLVEWLEKSHPKIRGPVRQFSHQLVRRSAEHKRLAEIRRLGSRKGRPLLAYRTIICCYHQEMERRLRDQVGVFL